MNESVVLLTDTNVFVLFLGYALTQIPDVVCTLYAYLKTRFYGSEKFDDSPISSDFIHVDIPTGRDDSKNTLEKHESVANCLMKKENRHQTETHQKEVKNENELTVIEIQDDSLMS